VRKISDNWSANARLIPSALRLDVCPVAECDRLDGSLVVGEEIPGLTAFVEDVLVVIIDGDGELILAQVLPDVLHRIEFWRVGRQGQKADVVWRLEAGGGVVSGAVEDEDGVRPGCDLFADFSQMKRKCFGVGVWQDESGRGTARRTSRTEEIGPFVAQIARRAGTRSSLRPNPRQRALLTNASFVLEPDFQWLATGVPGQNGRDRLGEVFLKASWACGSLFGCCGLTESRT
jgi:hypothetical protein